MAQEARIPAFSRLDRRKDPSWIARSAGIVNAVMEYSVEADPGWPFVIAIWPSVSYFATDLDPRSFERSAEGTWTGRAELLLTARGEVRPGQPGEISFTLPVHVELFERDGTFSVKTFEFAEDIRKAPQRDLLERLESFGAHDENSSIEAELAAIWCRLLKVSHVGLDSNFFDLGGTSLDLIQLHGEILTRFGDISITTLFEVMTIRNLAAYLQSYNRGKMKPGRFDAKQIPSSVKKIGNMTG